MNNIFKRILNWFNRLAYPKKFNVIAVIFILPIIGFLPLVSDQNTHIDRYGRRELFGTLYLRPLWQLTEDIQALEIVHLKYTAGEAPFSDVEAAKSVIEGDFEEWARIQNNEILAIPLKNEADAIQAEWLELKSAIESSDTASIETNQPTIYKSIHELVVLVGDYSFLILDPDLDTYYMMDIVLLELPENQELFFQAHKLATGIAQNQFVSTQDQVQLAILLSQIQTNVSNIDRDMKIALENNRAGDMATLVSTPFQEYQSAVQTFADSINADLANPSLAQSIEVESLYSEVRHANTAFYSAASEALEIGISARVNVLILRFYFAGLIALLGAAAAFVVGQAVMQAISKPLVQLAEATQLIATGDLTTRIVLENKEDELGLVANAFNQMIGELEAERTALVASTRDLENANRQNEKRARDLQSISEISRAITTEKNLGSLLPLITRLISEKFNYYHIGIFLVDDNRRSAVLHASNSVGGQRMLARGHRLEFGRGVVGNVAATGIPRIALDVGADPVFFNNPDLPNTRSEISLPLQVSDDIIGVLDAQSIELDAFKEEDIEVLSTLADQVAISIQNARLFEITQKLLEEAQRTSGFYLQDSWRTLKSQSKLLGYQISGNILKPLDQFTDSVLIAKVSSTGETVVEHGEGTNLTVPIRLAGNIVGVVSIRSPEEHDWEKDVADIVQAIADRLSLALESATLLEATQKRSEIERLTAGITGKIGSTTQIDSILRTAAEELSRALGGSDVLVQIQSDATEENTEIMTGMA